jgi:threonine dehydrogenase-like Zn-dependent dehydrogenase
MKAAIWNDKGSLDVVERPAGEPKPGQVRIRVSSVGICGTDLHFYRGSFPSPRGLLPGHEIGGVVDAAGDGVELQAGTPVAVEPQTLCGECYQCRTGNHNRCIKRVLFGVTARGGCAEMATFPAYTLYRLPQGVDPSAGALVEPLAVCLHGTLLGRIRPGQRIAILGAGTIGLMSVLTARLAGASEIFVTARHPHQQQAARAMGADGVFPDVESLLRSVGDAPADCVIETVGGHSSTLIEAGRMVRPGGIVLMLGVFDGETQIPALDYSTKEITLVGSNCYSRSGTRTDFAIAVDLLGRELTKVTSLVTHRFPLAAVNEAFRTAADKSSGSIKVHILPRLAD